MVVSQVFPCHMRIDHGRTQACMTQQYLNGVDVAPIFKKVGKS